MNAYFLLELHGSIIRWVTDVEKAVRRPSGGCGKAAQYVDDGRVDRGGAPVARRRRWPTARPGGNSDDDHSRRGRHLEPLEFAIAPGTLTVDRGRSARDVRRAGADRGSPAERERAVARGTHRPGGDRAGQGDHHDPLRVRPGAGLRPALRTLPAAAPQGPRTCR